MDGYDKVDLAFFASLCADLGAPASAIYLRDPDTFGGVFGDPSLKDASGLAIVGAASREALVVALPDGVAIGQLRLVWTGPVPPPVPRLRPIAVVRWSELDQDCSAATARLQTLANEAGTRRHRTFRACSECGERTPPEHLFELRPPVCMGCAERNHGVIF